VILERFKITIKKDGAVRNNKLVVKPMAINSDIRDQAYQFFVEEAPELLQAIEAGLLTLTQERSTAEVHHLMRSAHSIKGGAASVGLEAIATLAHRLENIFKALYSDTLTIDVELETQLFRAYDCLRLPLMEQITAGRFDSMQALATAEPIFDQLEDYCGEALLQTQTYIPSSADLGVDMVTSIFAVDVAEGLDRLTAIVAQPQAYEVAGELRAQVEVFSGFAELLSLPEFGAIAATVQQALEAHPDLALEITQLALVDFAACRQAVLTGRNSVAESDRSKSTGPSAALSRLADSTAATLEPNDLLNLSFDQSELDLIHVTDVTDVTDGLESIAQLDSIDFAAEPTDLTAAMTAAEGLGEELESTFSLFDNLEDIFGGVFTTDIGADENINFNDLDDRSDPDLIIAEVLSPSESSHPDLLTENLLIPIENTVEVELDQQTRNQLISKLISQTVTEVEIDPNYQFDPNSEGIEAIDAEWVDSDSEITQIVSAQSSFSPGGMLQTRNPAEISASWASSNPQGSARSVEAPASLTVRVDSSRLEKMNNLVGELAINRDALSLQNDQLQGVVKELLGRFTRFQAMVNQLREFSDQMLVAPERYSGTAAPANRRESAAGAVALGGGWNKNLDYRSIAVAEFDSLEMDRYGALHPQLQEILENVVQLEETVDDVALFARQSDQMLDQQRNRLSQLQDEVIWARMLPLGEVLNRFPRMLRDLSNTYQKPVQLKLTGTGVLIEKAILEKLYDPLLHLIRNAFDHGIEPIQLRQERGKPEQGQIEIRAYHRGNQTMIEIEDDGQGLNLDRIRRKALERGLVTSDELLTATSNQLFELIFEPGFSTAERVSELSGRGVGLDVVRSQLRAIKGTATVVSSPGKGTTFTLRLPLTLTITRLVICIVNSVALALPADSVEEILTPQADQIKQSGAQQFLYWREQIVPTYRLSDLLSYACPLPDLSASKSLATAPTPQDWAAPVLIFRHEQQTFALEVDRLVTEQELVIKSFGSAIASPGYAYGCTILGDGSLVPVLDPNALLAFSLKQLQLATPVASVRSGKISSQSSLTRLPHKTPTVSEAIQAPTILVVDDAVTLRRTLALSLERAGFRVLQARDGREAIAQFQKSRSVQLIVCDVEMPNMNGFEFLTHRRQDADLAAVPVVMLTSRSHEKHRWLAMQLGATAYFTKPYLEQEFLATLTKLVNQNHSG
jgi:two-component system, chemotaxis family, sensor histidine kinase and response regulator PixL